MASKSKKVAKNLYFLARIDDDSDYDMYADAVVCASSEEEARNIHPAGSRVWNDAKSEWQFTSSDVWAGSDSWTSPRYVEARLIGIADDSIELGSVICSSFHAG